VGAVVIEHGALLLVRRGRPPAVGRWSIPGGRVEHGETITEAVRREVAEETGVDVVVGDLVGWVERIGAGHHFVILDFHAAPAMPGTAPLAGDDADEAAYVELAKVPELELVAGLEDFLRDHGVLEARR
jgi:ADP-ribose pyrophosphatase YjhB (NUDIX family)